MCQLAHARGAFYRVVHGLQHGLSAQPPYQRPATQVQTTRMKMLVQHMPTILHTWADGVVNAHTAGIVHCNLCPFNILLDYTRTN